MDYIKEHFTNGDMTLKIYGEVDALYFCGSEVCKALGYTDLDKAIRKFVPYKYKKYLKGFEGPAKTAGPCPGDFASCLGYSKHGNVRKAIWAHVSDENKTTLKGSTPESYTVHFGQCRSYEVQNGPRTPQGPRRDELVLLTEAV